MKKLKHLLAFILASLLVVFGIYYWLQKQPNSAKTAPKKSAAKKTKKKSPKKRKAK